MEWSEYKKEHSNISASRKIKSMSIQLETTNIEIETQLKSIIYPIYFGDSIYYKALNFQEQEIISVLGGI